MLQDGQRDAEQQCKQLTAEVERLRAQQTSVPRVGRAANATPTPTPAATPVPGSAAADAQVLDALERVTKLADERQRRIDVLNRELQLARSSSHGAAPPGMAEGRRPQVRSAEGQRTPLPPIPSSRGSSRAASRASSFSEAEGRSGSNSRSTPHLPPNLPRPPPPREQGAVPAASEAAAARETIEVRALLQTAEAERDELTNLNAHLRQKVEQLEAKVARLRVAEASLARASADPGDGAEVQLAIEREEKAALRARLEAAVAHKQEEVELLRNMMRETRRVFAEAVAKIKASAAGNGHR